MVGGEGRASRGRRLREIPVMPLDCRESFSKERIRQSLGSSKHDYVMLWTKRVTAFRAAQLTAVGRGSDWEIEASMPWVLYS